MTIDEKIEETETSAFSSNKSGQSSVIAKAKLT